MKVNLKTHKWIKAPFNKGYVLVSKEYLKQFKKKGNNDKYKSKMAQYK